MAMLEVKDLAVYYGMIHAIKGVSFEVNKGEIIALIGANGAGKTTILHTITGLLSPKRGSIQFEGKELTKIPAHKIVSLGMAHVPEGRRVFAELSVYQNLKLGAYTRSDKKEIEETMETVCLVIKQISVGGKIITFWRDQLAFVFPFHNSKQGRTFQALIRFIEQRLIDTAFLGSQTQDLPAVCLDPKVFCQHGSDGLSSTSILSGNCNNYFFHSKSPFSKRRFPAIRPGTPF